MIYTMYILCGVFVLDCIISYRRLRAMGSINRSHHVADHILLAVGIVLSIHYFLLYTQIVPLIVVLTFLLLHLKTENTNMLKDTNDWAI